MIRDKNKIYGEVNDPNTVLVDDVLLTPKRYLTGVNDPNEPRKIKSLNVGNQKILIKNSIYQLDGFSYVGSNKLIGTNASGNLALLDRVPDTPDGLVRSSVPFAEALGSQWPDGPLGIQVVTLDPFSWYEVEVIGAGGGGGAGAGRSYYNNISRHGGNGGHGGYYTMKFKVLEARNAALHAGSSGGGDVGWEVKQVDSSNREYSGDSRGAAGGRSPITYLNFGENGQNAKYAVTQSANGGSGINGGANGGSSELSGIIGAGTGTGGGGGNGPYGGNGGRFTGEGDAAVQTAGGGGGGAGGGLGPGGNSGANLDVNDNVSRAGRVGNGGGGGGNGVYRSDAPSLLNQSCGGGGGGGGASRFFSGEVSIICGGGGGGAGGGSVASGNWYVHNADHGGHNQGGAQTNANNQGIGGEGVYVNTVYPVGTIIKTHGTNGGRGRVTLWKLVRPT